MVKKHALIIEYALITKYPRLLRKGTAHFLHTSASVVAGAESGDDIFVLSSVIHGHHIYKTVRSPSTGEILEAAHEPDNPHDHHAVLVSTENGSDLWPRTSMLRSSILFFPKSWWENYV